MSRKLSLKLRLSIFAQTFKFWSVHPHWLPTWTVGAGNFLADKIFAVVPIIPVMHVRRPNVAPESLPICQHLSQLDQIAERIDEKRRPRRLIAPHAACAAAPIAGAVPRLPACHPAQLVSAPMAKPVRTKVALGTWPRNVSSCFNAAL